MPAKGYEALSLIGRYWFALLGVIIVWRAGCWIRKDASLRRRVLRQLPDAGYIGEFVVLSAESSLQAGDCLPIAYEGSLGSARSCDVCIPSRTLPAHCAHYQLRPDGLHLWTRKDDFFTVDDLPVEREAVLQHGAMLQMEGFLLQLRLFEGLPTTRIQDPQRR